MADDREAHPVARKIATATQLDVPQLVGNTAVLTALDRAAGPTAASQPAQLRPSTPHTALADAFRRIAFTPEDR